MANPLEIAQAVKKRLEEKADFRGRVRLGFVALLTVQQEVLVSVVIGEDAGQWTEAETEREVGIEVLCYVRLTSGGEAAAMEQLYRAQTEVQAQLESAALDGLSGVAGFFRESGGSRPAEFDGYGTIAAMSSQWTAGYKRALGQKT